MKNKINNDYVQCLPTLPGTKLNPTETSLNKHWPKPANTQRLHTTPKLLQ